MAAYYVTVCRTHKVHTEDCLACRNFDQAAREYFKSFTLPPSQHPAVIAIQTREWIEKTFPTTKP